MTLLGTIQNGQVRLESPSDLPDGTPVRVLPDIDEDEVGPPPATQTYTQYLASLKASIELGQSGRRGRSVAKVFAGIELEFDRPLASQGSP